MFRKQLLSKFFSSIVVSISACHSIQLAGGRGSIPRWRDLSFCILNLFLLFFLVNTPLPPPATLRLLDF
jgi:hypothetical protein